MRIILLMAGLILSGPIGKACSLGTYTFSTQPGATSNSNPVGATAVFTVMDAHDFSVTLYNTETPMRSAGQLLTDLEFDYSFAQQNLNTSMTESHGQQIYVDRDGTTALGHSGSTGWGFGWTGNDFLLCIICTDGIRAAGTPEDGIIGPGPYGNANSSIAGNGAHNPYLESGATFTFHTSATLSTISNPFSNVSFSFGTNGSCGGPNPEIPGVPPGGSVGTVPEPVTFGLCGAGLVGIGLLRRGRK